jgi:2-keto-4-pentenoate hydratase/2-oxohepta-3-ene-1,7-dioic acid hydratase in catechol pathway
VRLVTFQHDGPDRSIGAVVGDRVVDLSARLGEFVGPEATLLDLIRMNALSDLNLDRLTSPASSVPLSEVRLHAPIPLPVQNVICLGRNYQEHAAEMARARNDVVSTTFFTKAVTSIVGPYDDIPLDPALTTQLDWEAELGFVIGQRARHVHQDEAMDYVFGYMIVNDLSARDLQYGHGGQFFYGKSLDGTCPTGPWIITADEVPDAHALPVRLRVNGETKQDGNTRDMIFRIPEIIETLSRAMTLEPGQIVATGTPPGVGYGRDPKEFLQDGDVVETEIEGIGVLRNRVQAV